MDVSRLPVPAWLARALPALFDAGFEHMALMGHDLCAVMWCHGRTLSWLRTTAAEEGLSHLELVRAEDGPLGHIDTRVRFGLLIELVDSDRVHVEVRRRVWAWSGGEPEDETRRTLECASDAIDADTLLRLLLVPP
jgi:hypothetical protein